MKRTFIFVFLATISFAVKSQVTNWVNYSDPSYYTNQLQIYSSFFADSLGNVYSVGVFKDSITLHNNPSGTNTTISKPGSHYLFQKLDSSGNIIQLGYLNRCDENGPELSISQIGQSGNFIAFVGDTNSTYDIDPGSGVNMVSNPSYTNPYNTDKGIMVMYDKNFNILNYWNSFNFSVSFFKALPSGFWLAGEVDTISDIDLGAGTILPTIYSGYPGYQRTFCSSFYDWSGNLISQFSFGAANQIHTDASQIIEFPSRLIDAETDNSGNIYLLGQFGDSINANLVSGNAAIGGSPYLSSFIIKINLSGQAQWLKYFTDVHYNTEFQQDEIVLDANNNVYYSGYLSGYQNDIDPGPGTYYTSSHDLFIVKLDSNGIFKNVAYSPDLWNPRNKRRPHFLDFSNGKILWGSRLFSPSGAGILNHKNGSTDIMLVDTNQASPVLMVLDTALNLLSYNFFNMASPSGNNYFEGWNIFYRNGFLVSSWGSSETVDTDISTANSFMLPPYSNILSYYGIGTTTNISTLKNESRSSEILLWPNPANTNLNIFRADTKSEGQLTVSNLTGELVTAKKISNGQSQLILDTESWKPGIYFVNYFSAYKTETIKVVIAR